MSEDVTHFHHAVQIHITHLQLEIVLVVCRIIYCHGACRAIRRQYVFDVKAHSLLLLHHISLQCKLVLVYSNQFFVLKQLQRLGW